jgi:hypothetical protein
MHFKILPFQMQLLIHINRCADQIILTSFCHLFASKLFFLFYMYIYAIWVNIHMYIFLSTIKFIQIYFKNYNTNKINLCIIGKYSYTKFIIYTQTHAHIYRVIQKSGRTLKMNNSKTKKGKTMRFAPNGLKRNRVLCGNEKKLILLLTNRWRYRFLFRQKMIYKGKNVYQLQVSLITVNFQCAVHHSEVPL